MRWMRYARVCRGVRLSVMPSWIGGPEIPGAVGLGYLDWELGMVQVQGRA